MKQTNTLEQKCAKAGGNNAKLGLNYHKGCPLPNDCQYKSEHAYTIVLGDLLPCCKKRYKK